MQPGLCPHSASDIGSPLFKRSVRSAFQYILELLVPPTSHHVFCFCVVASAACGRQGSPRLSCQLLVNSRLLTPEGLARSHYSGLPPPGPPASGLTPSCSHGIAQFVHMSVAVLCRQTASSLRAGTSCYSSVSAVPGKCRTDLGGSTWPWRHPCSLLPPPHRCLPFPPSLLIWQLFLWPYLNVVSRSSILLFLQT